MDRLERVQQALKSGLCLKENHQVEVRLVGRLERRDLNTTLKDAHWRMQ